MGYFSWLFANKTKTRTNLMIDECGYVACPDGTFIRELSYDGYGMFGGQDIYELVADWNREYLAGHPDFLILQPHQYKTEEGKWVKAPPKAIQLYKWYPTYCDLSLSREKMAERLEALYGIEYRSIGIDIACYDDQNAKLPYPIKIVSKTRTKYEDLPASEGDPEQGMCHYNPNKHSNLYRKI